MNDQRTPSGIFRGFSQHTLVTQRENGLPPAARHDRTGGVSDLGESSQNFTSALLDALGVRAAHYEE